MSARLIDAVLSAEGAMIGVVYVLGWTVIVCALIALLDRSERRRMDRIAARVVEEDRRLSAEERARLVQ